MEFVALDVETANHKQSSICQIGIVKYRDGLLVDEWKCLINPNDYFDVINVGIHGITEKDVVDAPVFSEIYEELKSRIEQTYVAHHTHFDKLAICKALSINKLPNIDTTWLDTAKLARRTWKQVSKKGYGLKNVATNILGYDFDHHDALEDAKACAQIVLAAEKLTGLALEETKELLNKRAISNSDSASIKNEGNPDGSLFGEYVVFTGSLSIPRKEASDYAAHLGCCVSNSITKKTTILVVGDQDIEKLAGKSKSSKHLKVEQLIKDGQAIKILCESDFVEMLNA